jgi:hypothetical protein
MKNIFLAILLISIMSCGQQDPIDKIIERNNLMSGQMIDQITMFNNAYISGDLFYYDYTMINCESPMTEFDKKVFEKSAYEILKNSISTLEEFKIIGENDKTIIFKYNCLDQSIIAEIRFEYNDGLFNYIREESEWNEAVDLMYEKMLNPN